ncbi:MAG: endolytic transglycosylase MltG [Candidatus Heteroscillospira sp.]|jgi:UPF0755 protein
MPDNMNFNDDFDWEELLRRTSAPGDAKKEQPEPIPDTQPENEPASQPEPIPEPRPEPESKPEPEAQTRPKPRKESAKPQPEYDEDDEDDGFDYENERDYMPIKPRRDGRIGCLGGLMYAVFVISVSIILACMAWMFASDVLALNKPEVSATITLPKTAFSDKQVDKLDEDGKVIGKETIQVADIDYVAEQLKDAGIIEYKFLFKLFSAFSHADTKLDPGTYELSTVFDYRALVKKMTTGSPSQMTTKLTFPEGYTMEQIFSLLEENDICSKEDLYEAAANYQFSYTFVDEEKEGDASRLEGFLFPDTYEFYEGERPYSVINKFLYNFYYRFTAEMIDKAEKRGMTVAELVTVASMVEREAGSDEDRYNIASVIYNRLQQGMPLQIDATIQYILPERVDVLTEAETSIDSPYNTYKNTGLPPTPIANPGMASIRAALDPASSSYLFYALDTETGTHRFFNTYAEHQAFVATQNYGA